MEHHVLTLRPKVSQQFSKKALFENIHFLIRPDQKKPGIRPENI